MTMGKVQAIGVWHANLARAALYRAGRVASSPLGGLLHSITGAARPSVASASLRAHRIRTWPRTPPSRQDDR
jgi:hypothetical protein